MSQIASLGHGSDSYPFAITITPAEGQQYTLRVITYDGYKLQYIHSVNGVETEFKQVSLT